MPQRALAVQRMLVVRLMLVVQQALAVQQVLKVGPVRETTQAEVLETPELGALPAQAPSESPRTTRMVPVAQPGPAEPRAELQNFLLRAEHIQPRFQCPRGLVREAAPRIADRLVALNLLNPKQLLDWGQNVAAQGMGQLVRPIRAALEASRHLRPRACCRARRPDMVAPDS